MAFFNLQFIPFMLHFFLRDLFLTATLLRVLSFPAGSLTYFGTSVRQTVDGDGGMRSRKHSLNNRILH